MNNRLRLGIDGLLLKEILFGFLCIHCLITDIGYWTASPIGRPKGLLVIGKKPHYYIIRKLNQERT
jgi:hypothetical protein